MRSEVVEGGRRGCAAALGAHGRVAPSALHGRRKGKSLREGGLTAEFLVHEAFELRWVYPDLLVCGGKGGERRERRGEE
jgi:hypothetical protein